MKEELKTLYIALSRAVEDGNDLKLGIVIGQVISKLNELINDGEVNGKSEGIF